MKARNRTFYRNWAIGFIILIAIAFAPKYWLLLLQGQFDFPKDIHWHAVFATAWILIYFAQVLLIDKRNFRLHQRIGFASLVVTVGVLISGFFVSIGLVERALVANNAGAKPLLLVNLLDLLMFGILYGIGLRHRKSGLKHKRLMTIATIVLLNAAIFRIGRFVIGPGFFSVLLAIFLTSGTIILYMILEKKHSQKPNKTIWRIVIAIILIHIVRIPLAITPVWADISDFILATF